MIWSFAPAIAQSPTFLASVDNNQVAVGEQIEVTFTLSGSTAAKNFRAPAFTDFDVLSGPNQSTNMQFVNGSMSSSVSFGYVVAPKKEGKLIIGEASIDYGGRTLQTQPVPIAVTKVIPQKQGIQRSKGNEQESSDITRQIGDNLFLKVVVDKSKAYQGEQITATYKLYNRVRLANLGISKLPALTGFWNEDVEEIKQVQFTTEVVSGKQYNVAVLKKVALFPQRDGTLEIDPMEVNCVVQVQTRRRSNDLFDQFFNDPFFGNYSNINHKVRSEPVKISVTPLPPASAGDGFSGAVGRFSMEAWIDKRQVKANEAATLKVKIAGRGSLKLLEAPAIVVPPDIERYDPKISDNITREGNAIAGSRTFEYLLIPRHAGEQRIASFPFSYFDPDKKAYVKLRSPEFVLTVEKGSELTSGPAVGISKEDVKLLGEDIRFIKSESIALRRRGETFVGSAGFYALAMGPVVSFVGFFVFMRRREEAIGDVVGMRKRKARKMAQRRLAEAKKFLDHKKKEQFYTEISRALWGYVGDKLSLPPSDLSVDAVRDSLRSRGVADETVVRLASTIERCEFARFAPSSDSVQMDSFYLETVELISEIENEIR
ncbi:MAG TPA: BatD family protein [Bacteroidota bacterium]|nr:BatD family protein [Bacteroidota bacterium]